jgi:hypothetical protein
LIALNSLQLTTLGKVEVAVLLTERWLIAALRHEKFFSLAELNQALGKRLERLNQRPFRKREGTRASLYATLDRPALQPLPAERYVMAHWTTVRVNIDYHVEVDRHYYSVPYQLANEQLEARFTAHTVEIFHRGKRVASHMRSFAAYHHSVTEHMPKSHQAHLEWTPSRLIHWGESVGGGHGATHPHHPGKQTASGDGLSRLSRHSALGQDLLRPSTGSGLPTCPGGTGLFLSEPEIHPEARLGPTT